MINQFDFNTYYYVRYTIPSSSKDTPMSIEMNPSTNYRVNGGTWATYSGTFEFGYNNVNDRWIYYDGSVHQLSSGDVIEFYGRCSSPFIPSNDDWNDLLNSTIKSPYVFDAYQLQCEQHKVNKGGVGDLLFVNHIYGVLREEANVLTPSILIEYNIFPTFNYIHIPSFNRYYFVQSVTCVRNNVYRIELKVDVLYSFDTDIRKQDGFIARNENTSKNVIVDERLTLESKYTQYSPTITNGSLKNITFSTSGIIENVVVVASSEKYSDSTAKMYDIFTRPNSLTDVVNPYLFTEKKIFVMVPHSQVPASPNTYEQALLGFFKCAFNKSAIGDSVLNVIAFPFNVYNTGSSYATYLSVNDSWIGYDGSVRSGGLTPKDTSSYDSDDTIKAYLMYNQISKFLVISDFTFPYPQVNGNSVENTDYQWLAYEPYSNYEIYIPYYGWLKVNSKDVLGKRIIIYYSVNYITGASNVYVESLTDKKIIFSATCQLGTLLSVSVSNKTELNNQKNANALNLILGLISSAISIGAGAVTGNPIAVSGGAIAGGKTIAETINKSSVLFERTQATLHDSNAGIYGIQNVLVKIYTRQPTKTIDSVYKRIQGLPLNENLNLSSITGYTEISELHYEPDTQGYITKNEIDEIISLARDGIIL